MDPSLLPLMFLLISNIHPGQTQGKPKAVVITEPDKEGSSWPFSSDREFSIMTVSGRSINITSRGDRRSDGQKSEIRDAAPRHEGPEENRNQPKVTVKPQSSVFTGDTVTLSCDVRQSAGQTIIWFKDFKKINPGDVTKTLRNVTVSDGGNYACSVGKKTKQSQRLVLTVWERPKPVVHVLPAGRVFRGQTVTLTCDIQETNVSSWIYSWNKDDSVIHVSQSQEYRISSVSESHTGNYSCTGNETQGSRYSHTSDEFTLTVSGSSVPEFPKALFNALIIGVISGLSGAFLLIFLLAQLFCCKRNKDGGSPSLSTDHQLQNISQTSEHQGTNEQTPSYSNTVIGPSCENYVKIDIKSMKEMKKKNKENKEKESSDTVYSKLKI